MKTVPGIVKKQSVLVVPIGRVPDIACKAIVSHIRTLFHLDADILQPLPEARYAHDPLRNQYNAAHILNRLESTFGDTHTKILGVLNVDLFIPVFTHVFGEAREGGQCALVSLFRLRDRVNQARPSQDLILERTVKVALHELSHLFSIPHCTETGCLMHFSMNLRDLDATPLEFCKYCDAYLKTAIRRFSTDAHSGPHKKPWTNG